mmetsp:Transcript_3073/g.12783  ORF Transcript_3073/g.12783 Transcript_3073/m.12783 type:complete len:201 (+) Transcript_3073:1929-2531(+)
MSITPRAPWHQNASKRSYVSPLAFVIGGVPCGGVQHDGFVCLEHRAVCDHLVQHVVRLLQVEHYVQLAHVAEVPVQGLHRAVYELVNRELVLVFVHAHQEIKRRVPTVNNLRPAVLDERALLVRPSQALAHDLALDLTPLLQGDDLVVRRQTGLALLVHQQDEPDGHRRLRRRETAAVAVRPRVRRAARRSCSRNEKALL